MRELRQSVKPVDQRALVLHVDDTIIINERAEEDYYITHQQFEKKPAPLTAHDVISSGCPLDLDDSGCGSVSDQETTTRQYQSCGYPPFMLTDCVFHFPYLCL